MILDHSQLPVLLWLTIEVFSIISSKEYNQSDFCIGHFCIGHLMSMCRVISYVVVSGYLL